MNALVTGASSGIGRAVAQALVARGDTVLAVGNETKPDVPCATLCVDITNPDAADFVIEHALSMGSVDALVNAAGILQIGSLALHDDEDWDKVFDLNVHAVRRLMRAAYPMLFRAKGSIVNVSSINANRPFANTAAYSASKAAIDQLTRVAAIEWAPNIRVNAVNPGVVVTNLHRRAGMTETNYAQFIARGHETHPLGRPGQPEDIASAVLFLLDHQWITGVTLPVDGGRHLTVVR